MLKSRELTNNPYWGAYAVGFCNGLMVSAACVFLTFGPTYLGMILAAGVPVVILSIIWELRKKAATIPQDK